jgi:hypothetical protein
MSTLPFYRKRELSPLRRACLSLGLPVDGKPKTNHSWLLRKSGLGNTAVKYLRFSDDDQARRIVKLYDSLANATERKAVTIDFLADPSHSLQMPANSQNRPPARRRGTQEANGRLMNGRARAALCAGASRQT